MPDLSIRAALSTVQRRWRVRSLALSIAAGGAAFALALILSAVAFRADRARALPIAALSGMVIALASALRRPSLTDVAAARAIESVTALDNLIVTAAELDERPRPVSAGIREEIVRQATERARSVDPAAAVPLGQPIGIAAVVLIGCGILVGLGSSSAPGLRSPEVVARAAGSAAGSLQVRIVPPAYSGRPAQTIDNPIQVTALAGSEVWVTATVDEPSGVRQSRMQHFFASQSVALEVRASDHAEARFLSLIVVPDLPPTIRVVAPGKDTAFAAPAGRVEITIQSGDDLGLAALSLRFTKASGGGEAVSFTDGEVPLRLERRSTTLWHGRADITLDSFGLADGDILVYRAIARDINPNGVPVPSDQYLIEIGRNAEIADAGFALPSEEKKYAISQQMVIYHTEQLLQRRLPQGDVLLEQARNIAMEQRMVRAEVIFLGGGEVQDEVEEAAHSHELAEGRLENTGRAEMLRAINAMSRAEALLNDGNVTQALVLEREALVHLERALDRRRYFLRTISDRSRIDATRRLTGDRRAARSWPRAPQRTLAAGSLEAQRSVMRELASGNNGGAALAARLAAIDPSSVALQNAAVALASATSSEARDAAARSAMAALTAHALRSLSPSAAVGLRLEPLAGRLAEELRVRP